jgi:UDP-N-acetylmuramate--alanine ligase
VILPLKPNQAVHFIGIGGAGMSALAFIALARGMNVTGSDVADNATTRKLEEAGAIIMRGHHEAHVACAGLVVYSTAIAKENPELVEARRMGVPVWHRSRMLASIMNSGESVSICGSHGKSTTSAMTTLVLETAGLEPTFLMGAKCAVLGTNARNGDGRHVVAETDESDGSFLNICPTHAIVTNIDSDHLDHFGSIETLKKEFAAFIGGVAAEGTLVMNADCPMSREVMGRIERRPLTYGLFPRLADVRARAIELRDGGASFVVDWRGHQLGTIELNVPGLHNVSNALAVVTLLRSIDVPFAQIAAGLAAYRGIERRMERRGIAAGITVIDDYAHHPAEIAATLDAVGRPIDGRLIALFQPHRYSRTQLLADEFGGAFHHADTVVITDIYSAGEAPIAGVSGRRVYDAVRASGHPHVVYCPTTAEAHDWLETFVGSGDLVMTMGAGDVWRTGDALLATLAEAMPVA